MKSKTVEWTIAIQTKFKRDLLSWYQSNQRSLPWRETSDPYHIWVSEVMLQQTQVKTVIPYYTRFLERFPTLRVLADSDVSNVLKHWEGLGYYSRARNFHKAVNTVVEEHGGSIPQEYAVFKRLPGVGDYIASAVQSIAFGHMSAVVDGNVKRVLARLNQLDWVVNHSSSLRDFQKLADTLLDHANPGDYNQAIMELGALICVPKNPDCQQCPVKRYCMARQKDVVAEYPKKIKRKKVPTHSIVVGIIRSQDRFLITLRKPEGMLGGLWEFPGGKVETGESLLDACTREIKEETNLTINPIQALPTIKHAYTHFKIELTPYMCDWISGDIVLSGPVDYRWIKWDDISDYAFPKANHKIFPSLKRFITDDH